MHTLQGIINSTIFYQYPTQVIHGLQRKVEEQEEEIIQLRRRISQLQSLQVRDTSSESDKT